MTATPSPDELFKALQLEHLTPEDQEKILLEMGDIIEQGVMIRLISLMDDQTRLEFEKLLDSESDEEEVEEFIKKHVPNSDKIIQDTIEELRDDILATTSK